MALPTVVLRLPNPFLKMMNCVLRPSAWPFVTAGLGPRPWVLPICAESRAVYGMVITAIRVFDDGGRHRGYLFYGI